MTTEFISQKLSEIKKMREKLIANLNALCGAEQADQEMLAELEKTAELKEMRETDEHN